VDTHADSHVAAAVDRNRGLLGVESFSADSSGFEELLGWLVGFGQVVLIGFAPLKPAEFVVITTQQLAQQA
jgi:hypothetical protein